MSYLWIHFHNVIFEKVLCKSMVNWSMSELLFIQHEKTNRFISWWLQRLLVHWNKSNNAVKWLPCVVLALLGGLGWQLIGGVNISNASPKCLQSVRVILVVAVIIHQVIFPVTPPVDSILSWVPLPFWPTWRISLSFPAMVPSKLSIVYSSLPCPPPLQAWNCVAQCMTTDMFM